MKLTDQKKQKIKRTILNIYSLLEVEDAKEICNKIIECLEKMQKNQDEIK